MPPADNAKTFFPGENDMCGRFTQSVSLSAVADKYRLAPRALGHEAAGLFNQFDGESSHNYNLAPSETALMIRSERATAELTAGRFGIALSFGPSKATKLIINARAETALEKATFSRASRHSRAIIPANGYFEWMAPSGPGHKTPYFIRPSNQELSSLGALCFQDKKTAKLSFVILTQSANALLASIHDRMPVFIGEESLAGWLDEELTDPQDTLELFDEMQNFTTSLEFEFHPVTRAVGSPTFKSRVAIEPQQS